MAVSNRQRVGAGFEILAEALGPYVDQRMRNRFGPQWTALVAQRNPRGRDISLRDPADLLAVICEYFKPVFDDQLTYTERNAAYELRNIRNKWAHNESFTLEETFRALDTMSRLLDAIGASAASAIEREKREVLRLLYEGQTARNVTRAMSGGEAAGLRPWREVITPHEDVIQGRLSQAEFAANLYQVATGTATSAEYADPIEFFRRTYLTDGLRRLLTAALHRLTNRGGAPIIDLQTTFGGGKTHSLIALWHVCSGTPLSDFPQEMQDLFREADITTPVQVRRAAIVGTHLSPTGEVKPDGTRVSTLWGELAWQLGGAAGYAHVAEADQAGTNPGNALHRLFEAYAPCLVLIDEWVAYARQLITAGQPLPAGSFEAHMSFAQALTEAAHAVPGVLVVVSLPASTGRSDEPDAMPSRIELGGPGGEEALHRLRAVLGRMKSEWRPAAADESFEIVRRRLFQPLEPAHYDDRDTTARAFVTYYQSEKAEFGTAYGERSYEDRIKAAYPFHPELFDLLYEFWSTVERFQRTRGVLRLMALVVATLWQVGDRSPLILPSSVPLDDPAVRSELLGYLEDAWDSIISTDIDGADSIAARIDREAPNLGKYFAAEKVARTIFLGSAPMVRAPHRGLTQQRIRVGCALPGERPAVYNDALGRLARQANYLYAEEDRYWFGLSPSVGRLAQDRAAQYLQSRMDHIDGQICEHLRAKRNRGEFTGIHVTADPEDIPDDDRLRLVVLPPSHPHTAKAESSEAIDAAHRILEIRSGGPRRYRNMLVFLAPDHGRLDDLRQRFADLLAWQSINDEREKLNLTAQEVRQASERLDQARRACEQQLAQTYRFVLVPTQEATGPIQFTTLTLDGADASGEAVWRRLVNRGYASASYAPALLRRIVLEGPLQPEWEAGHISFRTLWDAFASYIYLPRLASREVLVGCVQKGPEGTAWEQEGFALADGYDEAAGRYLGLACGPQSAVKPITPDTLLVNPSRATAQRDADAVAVSATFTQPSTADVTAEVAASGPNTGGTASPPAKPRRFYGSVTLHSDRLAREFGEVQQEVLSHLADAGAAVEVTLEISATTAHGFDSKVVQIVSENATALRFRTHGFEAE